MKYFKICLTSLITCLLITFSLPSFVVLAQEVPHPNSYMPTLAEIEKHKKPFDDPRPFLKDFGPKQILPKELYAKLSYDEEKMKNLWAEIVGFRAPSLVGKIAPEIKPGKYTYKDLEKYTGFKDLMWPDLYKRIKPGGPPFIGNIPEFEIIPTRQYYWSLPIAEATQKNDGKTKQDKDGYIIPETWEGGYPFPRPSGPHKAQQIMFNMEKRYVDYENSFYLIGYNFGYTKNLKKDFEGVAEVRHMQLAGRVLMPPYGWYDKRAKDRGEYKYYITNFLSPRDIVGTALSSLFYLDPNRGDMKMIYLPSLRRVRKMTATDTQDPIMGQDTIWDDYGGFNQKLSPTRYPYKYEILEEREYLVVANTVDGAEYLSSKGFELRNVRMERRPIYVVGLTQLDSNYVYGKRILYIDKESFLIHHIENYDQKGRLYRTWDGNFSFNPEMGMFSWDAMSTIMRDHVDIHSTFSLNLNIPAYYRREEINVEGFIKQK